MPTFLFLAAIWLLVAASILLETGFDGMPYFPNQSQSTRRTGASNFFSPTPQSSNFTSGNTGSSSHYAGTHSWDWSGDNLQNNEGSLQSMVNPIKSEIVALR
uniref:Salivary secreted peptide n=1 Tax=Globodera rostochiensis TaxID=31243 RepID=A0A914HC55_GLORO